MLALAGIWGAAAWSLWQSVLPDDLTLTQVALSGVSEQTLERADRYERFFRIEFVVAQLVLLAVLAVYARHGGDLGAVPIREMVADHARIRGLVMTLIEEDRSDEVSPDTLRGIGEHLESHIRVEERRVFPLIETILSEEGLKEVGARIGT